MTKVELARKRFSEGFHCSQAVLEAFAEDYGLDPILSRKLANPLAGGSGIGGECGAVTGSFLVIGLAYGMRHPDDSAAFQTVFEKVGLFVNIFTAHHGNLNCRQLIGIDVFSEEGYAEFTKKKIKMTQCITYVADAVGILEEILKKKTEPKE